ncbi:hypothetical protein [Kitasatospora sp. NPDC090091]|uniref:hypothetical protein n=1 Tax=Kitasatospora sp. NPDC090091 TaxID=3364081 RepID=UPI0037F4FB7C
MNDRFDLPSESSQRATVSLPIGHLGYGPVITPEGPATPETLRLQYDGHVTGRQLSYTLSTTLYARLPNGETAYVELLDRPAGERPAWFTTLLQRVQPYGWSLPADARKVGTIHL